MEVYHLAMSQVRPNEGLVARERFVLAREVENDVFCRNAHRLAQRLPQQPELIRHLHLEVEDLGLLTNLIPCTSHFD